MKIKINLVIGQGGSVRLLRRMPSIDQLMAGEIVVPVTINVPDQWFVLATRSQEINLHPPERQAPTVEADVIAPQPSHNDLLSAGGEAGNE